MLHPQGLWPRSSTRFHLHLWQSRAWVLWVPRHHLGLALCHLWCTQLWQVCAVEMVSSKEICLFSGGQLYMICVMWVSHVGMLRPMGWSTGRKPSHTPSVWRPRNSVSSAMTVMSLSSMTQLKSKCFLLLILFSIDYFSAGILKVSERYSFKEIWRKLKKVLAAPEGSNHTHITFAMRLMYTTE